MKTDKAIFLNKKFLSSVASVAAPQSAHSLLLAGTMMYVERRGARFLFILTDCEGRVGFRRRCYV